MLCFYCKIDISFKIKYIVRKAIKPKGKDFRWVNIGKCCEECESKNRPLQYEFGESIKDFTDYMLVNKATVIRASKLKW